MCTVLRATLKKSVHRFACKLEICAPFCMQFELTCIVLRADSNIVHRFTCRIRKTCSVLHATLEKSMHYFVCQLEVRAPFCVQSLTLCTVLRAGLKWHAPFCVQSWRKACTVLRVILKKSMHHFACKLKVRAPFCMQVELACTVLRAV